MLNVWSVAILGQYHPDMNKGPGAEEKFKEISAAYEVIFVPFLPVLSSGNFLSYIFFLHFFVVFFYSVHLFVALI